MVTIAKFLSLGDATVADRIEVEWDQWLDYLAAEPANVFSGQMRHPGWSPVAFEPPARALANVRLVFALVLDYDKGADFERVYQLWAQSYGLIYTTKSHSSTATRLRAVLPLARAVSAEEYARLWQWGARLSADAGVPVDQACKDASRYWYDPSKPPGGWRAERLTGEAISPDGVLAMVEPPKLRVVPPPRVIDGPNRMHRAAKYLARIPGAVSGQGGHTATFNAVAHAMFGFDLDPDQTLRLITDHYNPRCDPPWSEKELLHKVRSVAEKCTRERGYLLVERPTIRTSTEAAQHAPEVAPEVDVDWTSLLLYKADRTPRRGYHNTAAYVRHHPDYRGRWSRNTMTGQIHFDGQPIDEGKVHELRAAADQRLGHTPSPADMEAAIRAAAADRPFHPILHYLRSLDWDGTPRLASMARDYLGTDAEHHAEMVRRFMISAAARVLWPGCKVDTALMLVGAQGIRKSTFFAVLGGAWHADTYIDITNKDGTLALHSAWLYELAELENVVHGRAESRLKAWLTSTHDHVRLPYERTMVRKPRGMVLCGTTNRQQFLTDDTGSRRFWIVPVHRRIDTDTLEACRDQLWAEALCAAEAGEPWWLVDRLASEVERANEAHAEDDPWEEPIAAWVSSPAIREVTTSEVLTSALRLDIARQDRAAQMRAARVLKRLGWERRRKRHGRFLTWVYVPTTTEDSSHVEGTEKGEW